MFGCTFEVELAIGKLKSHKSTAIDQIQSELIKARGRTVRCEIHKLIISICNKENYLSSGSSLSLYLSVGRAIKQTAVIIQPYHFC